MSISARRQPTIRRPTATQSERETQVELAERQSPRVCTVRLAGAMRFRTVAGLILAGYLLGVAREFRQTGRLLAWRLTEPELAALNGGASAAAAPCRGGAAAAAVAPAAGGDSGRAEPAVAAVVAVAAAAAAREKRAARCTPGCEPWCVPKFALAHCAACKCSGCAFCAEGGAEDDAPPPDDDAPSSAQRRPPPPPRLERPRADPRSRAAVVAVPAAAGVVGGRRRGRGGRRVGAAVVRRARARALVAAGRA